MLNLQSPEYVDDYCDLLNEYFAGEFTITSLDIIPELSNGYTEVHVHTREKNFPHLSIELIIRTLISLNDNDINQFYKKINNTSVKVMFVDDKIIIALLNHIMSKTLIIEKLSKNERYMLASGYMRLSHKLEK